MVSHTSLFNSLATEFLSENHYASKLNSENIISNLRRYTHRPEYTSTRETLSSHNTTLIRRPSPTETYGTPDNIRPPKKKKYTKTHLVRQDKQ